MRARTALFHHLQAFFETHLCGIYRYDDARPHVAEQAEQTTGRRRNAFGRVREIVIADFGDFTIKLESPHEVPPLGRIVLSHRGATVLSGSLEPTIFARAGEAVKKLEEVVT